MNSTCEQQREGSSYLHTSIWPSSHILGREPGIQQVPCQTTMNSFTPENEVNRSNSLVITTTDQAET